MALTTSILTGGSNSHTTTSEEVNFDKTDFFSPGVHGVMTNTSGVAPTTGDFSINAQGSPNMTVAVGSGSAYVTATPASGNSQLLRVKNSASTNVTIAANSSGGTRFDWLYIQIDATKAANPASDASDVATLVTSRSTSSTTDNGTPPTYGTLLAVITVANGASSITNGNIADKRVRALAVGGVNDTNGNEVIRVSATASAVNDVTFTNAATGNAPQIGASGDDTNIDLQLAAKGTGAVKLASSQPANFAGKLGYAESTSAFTTTTFGSFVDVTNLTTTVTVPNGGRDLKVTVKASVKTSGTAGNGIELAILDGSTIIEIFHADQPVAGFNVPMCFVGRVSAPSAGSHTYKVQAYQSGAGTLTVSGGARTAGNTGASYILVEAM